MTDLERARVFLTDVFGTTQVFFDGTDLLAALTTLLTEVRQAERMDALTLSSGTSFGYVTEPIHEQDTETHDWVKALEVAANGKN